jgi:AraC-like DNA-binding protein
VVANGTQYLLISMALISALIHHPLARTRLETALRVGRAMRVDHDLRFAADWAELYRLALAAPIRIAVFDPYLQGGLHLEPLCAFATRFPSVILIPYGAFREGSPRDVLHLARLGIDRIVCLGDGDDAAGLWQVIEGAGSGSHAEKFMDALGNRGGPELLLLLRRIFDLAHAPLDPRGLARLHCCHPKTLREHLRVAGLPSTNRLIVWARLCHAAFLLEDPARSVSNVARVLGFPSASALGKQMVRYTGVAPGDLAREGGIALLRALAERCGPRAKDAQPPRSPESNSRSAPAS